MHFIAKNLIMVRQTFLEQSLWCNNNDIYLFNYLLLCRTPSRSITHRYKTKSKFRWFNKTSLKQFIDGRLTTSSGKVFHNLIVDGKKENKYELILACWILKHCE